MSKRKTVRPGVPEISPVSLYGDELLLCNFVNPTRYPCLRPSIVSPTRLQRQSDKPSELGDTWVRWAAGTMNSSRVIICITIELAYS